MRFDAAAKTLGRIRRVRDRGRMCTCVAARRTRRFVGRCDVGVSAVRSHERSRALRLVHERMSDGRSLLELDVQGDVRFADDEMQRRRRERVREHVERSPSLRWVHDSVQRGQRRGLTRFGNGQSGRRRRLRQRHRLVVRRGRLRSRRMHDDVLERLSEMRGRNLLRLGKPPRPLRLVHEHMQRRRVVQRRKLLRARK